MIKFLLNLTTAQMLALRDIARKKGIPIAAQIRMAIDKYLKEVK